MPVGEVGLVDTQIGCHPEGLPAVRKPTWRGPAGIELLTAGDNILKLRLRTAGNRPFQIGRKMGSDVLGSQPSSVALMSSCQYPRWLASDDKKARYLLRLRRPGRTADRVV